MRHSTSTALVRISLAVLGFLGALGISLRPATADCYRLPSCDELRPECWECDTPISVFVSDAENERLDTQLGRSTGADLGATIWRGRHRLMTPAPLPPPPPVDVDQRPAARQRGEAYLALKDFQGAARNGSVPGQSILERYYGRNLDAMVAVPRDQGIDRDLTTSGEPRDAGPDAPRLDPVDPITGELIIEHDDLSLPGFGVTFSHRRTYRSRIDYDGPLGPGWDFSYNQRLAVLPRVESAEEIPSALDPETGLPVVDVGADTMNPGQPQHCGPVLVLTTGQGTTLRFREVGRTDAVLTYDSPAEELSLRGAVTADGALSWTLTTRAGDVRQFDSRGLLVGWRDPNGVGLRLTWQPGVARDWRLASVLDSVDREISYLYDGQDRLTNVTFAAGGLGARYEYDANGGLRYALRADGRSETYEYDVASGRDMGDWIPERQLEAACESACSMSSRSCDAGGACDKPVADATASCLAACPACAAECAQPCADQCGQECRDGCTPACRDACNDPGQVAALQEECRTYFDTSEADTACDACGDVCRAQVQSKCERFVTCVVGNYDAGSGEVSGEALCFDTEVGVGGVAEDLGWFLTGILGGLLDLLQCLAPPWDECSFDLAEAAVDRLCDTDLAACCAYGSDCALGSCTEQRDCRDECKNTFLGWGDVSGCPGPETPIHCGGGGSEPAPTPGTEEYTELLACAGTARDWARSNGCLPTRIDECEAGCYSECATPCNGTCTAACSSACAEACHVDDCTSYCIGLDLPGACERDCTDTCVADMRQRGPVPGPKYGFTTDLQFNIIRVYDGNGALYLENTYGADITRADFDTVVSQRYGAFTGEMRHANLTVGDELGDWAAALIDPLGDYPAPSICRYACEAQPPHPRDVAVPWQDTILVFSAHGDSELPAAGWTSSLKLDKTQLSLGPTFITVAADGTGRITPRMVPGLLSSYTGAFTVSMPEGKVSFSVDKSLISTLGDAPAVARLTSAGGLTVFFDGAAVRAYPGAPDSVLALASGSCTRPFHIERTGTAEVSIAPADACTKELWLAPVASRNRELDMAAFMAKGQNAIFSSHFRPSVLSPVRFDTVLTNSGDGRYQRARAASGSATDQAAKVGWALYTAAELFTVPLLTPPELPSASEPIYVFHQGEVPDGKNQPVDTYPPPQPPTDAPYWGGDTPDEAYDPPCDPSLPVATAWGNGVSGPGTKPAHATVIKDLHGARWTYYADEHGRLIRTVNHETGASRWMEYDPAGRVTGLLEPDGARKCMAYDAAGNVTEVLSLPAWHADLATPAPLRQRYGWTAAPNRLAVVVDPRDLTRALRRFEYDGLGNLRRVVEADGTRTEVALTGGTSAARAQPAAITGPDGSVTRYVYDTTNGTARTVTTDSTGASPSVVEIQSDAAGRPTWTTSPLGLIQTYSWDGPELASTTWDADGLTRTEAYKYDDDGRITTVTNGRQVIERAYDAIGGLRSTIRSATDASLLSEARCQLLEPGGRVREEVSAEGTRVRYAHDGEGRVISVSAGDLGPSPLSWDDSCLAQATGASASGTVATYEYDVSGRLIAAVDGRGVRTSWRHDGFGRPIFEYRPDGGQVRTGYDEVGNVIWQAVYSGAASAYYHRPQWGDVGLLAMVELHYDLRGRLDRETAWHFDAQGQAIGDGYSTTTYAYDEVARTITVTDDLGRGTRMTMDGAGRSVEVRLPDGSIVATAYLDGGRTVRTSRTAVGGPVVETTTLTATGATAETTVTVNGLQRSLGATTWADPFLIASSTSATGVVTAPSYDAFARVDGVATSVPGGEGETLSVVLDREGRVTERRSVAAAGAPPSIWKTSYDALGRVWREEDPAGQVSATEYVGATDLVAVRIDPRTVRTQLTWAPGGWAQSLVAGRAGAAEATLTFQHDLLGRMTYAARKDGAEIPITTTFTWDSLGNPTSENDDVIGVAAARVHRYDGEGQRHTSWIGSQWATRTFDALGRQKTLAVNGEVPATATWSYGAPGGPSSRVLRSGITTQYTYDQLSRLTGVSDWQGAMALAIREWELPLDGVPRRQVVHQPGSLGSNWAFAIDPAGRLVADQEGTSAGFQLGALDDPTAATALARQGITLQGTRYALDGRGNMDARETGGLVTAYGSDARDALTSIGGTAVATDAAGAVTSDGSNTYEYDVLGMLAAVHPGGGSGGRRYKRDAFGRIISETDIASGAITRFAWDGAQRVVVREPSGALETTFAAEGLDQPVVTLSAAGRQYYHQDRQGSVYGITSDTGAGLYWMSYTPYGEATVRDYAGRKVDPAKLPSTFGYHGLPHDFGLGMVDMRARAYRPALARFLSPDPIGLAGDASLFAFVNSGPLTWRDPLGLAKEYRNASGDALHLVNGDAFFYINGEPGVRSPRFHVWKAQSARWYVMSSAGYFRMYGDAYEREADPSLNKRFDEINASMQWVPALGMFACNFAWACRISKTVVTSLHRGEQAEACGGDERCLAELAVDAADDLKGAMEVGSGVGGPGAPKHVGASGERRQSPFNPDGGRRNCVNAVCAFLKSVRAKTLHAGTNHVASNGGRISTALNQITEDLGGAAQGVQVPKTGDYRDLVTAKKSQFFIVFKGSDPVVSSHVVVGIVKNGRKMIYDPQSGEKYTDISTFGPFIAFPVLF